MGKHRSSRSQQITSGTVAKMRLEQTLASDFLECSPEQFGNMQKEILEILSRYININETQKITMHLTQTRKQGVQYVKTIQIKGL